VSPSTDDNVMLGIDGGGSGLKVEEVGAGLWLMLGFVNFRMAHRYCRPLRWMAKGRVVGSKLMIRLIGKVVATVKAVGCLYYHLRCIGQLSKLPSNWPVTESQGQCDVRFKCRLRLMMIYYQLRGNGPAE
jgi:hypothetical protein